MFRRLDPKLSLVTATLALVMGSPSMLAQSPRPGKVQGVVQDASGRPVSGAFVKLKNAERRLTFMFISQAQGRYTAKDLPAGRYVVQGVGGDHQSNPATLDVTAGGPANLDLSLTAARAPQYLPGWPGRAGAPPLGPGALRPPPVLPEGAGKAVVETRCISCHDANRIVGFRADRAGWTNMIDDMVDYVEGSTGSGTMTDGEIQVLLDYAMANFSGERSRETTKPADSNVRLPRTLLQGDAAKYIAVEYELPNTRAMPHEVAVDAQGNGWAPQRSGGRVGRLDIQTLAYMEIDPPPAPSKKLRLNGIVSAPNNRLWFLDGGPNRRWLMLDPESREFKSYQVPPTNIGNASGNTMRVHPDGSVWLNSIAANQVIRLDPSTGEFKFFEVPAGIKAGHTASPYGLAIDGAGKMWIVEHAVNQMARLDPKTGEFDEYPIPVPNAVARKAGMDSNGDIWVGLHGAGILMKIDHKTAKMTLYDPPTENSGVYSVQGDPTSDLVWFSQQHVDMIARFDPKTETFTEYPVPNAESDHRRIDIDPNNPNRIWWAGNLSGRIGYIEVFD